MIPGLHAQNVYREKKRQEIAKKAVEVSAKRGFQATTIQDTAAAARLGKGTIYHYIKTKEEILITVSAEILKEMERPVGTVLLRPDEPEERLTPPDKESFDIGHVTGRSTRFLLRHEKE